MAKVLATIEYEDWFDGLTDGEAEIMAKKPLKSWEDIRDRKLGRRRAQKIRREAIGELIEEIVESDLPQVRKALHLTQVDVARRVGLTQAAISKIESSGDARLSLLRAIVEAMGGKLNVVAEFGGVAVKLGG